MEGPSVPVFFNYKKLQEENKEEYQGVIRYGRRFGVKSCVGIPIFYKKRVKAVLVIEYVERELVLEEGDLNFLKLLGQQANMAYTQILLYQKTKKRAEKERLLRKIFETMRSSLDVNVIKKNIVTEVGKALGVDICLIFLYNSVEKNFYVDEASEYIVSPDEKSFIGYTSDKIGLQLITDIFKQDREIHYEDIDKFIQVNGLQGSPMEKFLRSFDIKSGYSVLIHYANSLIGPLY